MGSTRSLRDMSAIASTDLTDAPLLPEQRAFLIAFAMTGHVARSCEAAGIPRSQLYTATWRHDHVFQAAYEEAHKVAGGFLEDAARERALDGVRRLKLSQGEAVRDPDSCDCGHDRKRWHVRPRVESAPANLPEATNSPCSHPDCDCANFEGAPYYEYTYSDGLLKFLLKGALPERYSDKVELKGALANLDMAKLSPEQVSRIAAGEHPLQVLASSGPVAGGSEVEEAEVVVVDDEEL